MRFPDRKELVAEALKSVHTLILFCAQISSDITQLIEFLKTLEARGKSDGVRVILIKSQLLVIDEFDQAKLNLHGCSEIVSEPIQEKNLAFKIDIHLKSLIQNMGSSSEHTMKSQNKAKEEKNEVLQNQTRRIGPPLELESDCWLTIRGSMKKIAGRWTIKLRGPLPEFGKWVRAELPGIEETAWRWEPTDPEKDPFIREEGSWYAVGQRPEYSDGGWLFGGYRPQVTFFYENEAYGSKFWTDEDGTLVTSSDSQSAVRSLSVIEELEEKKIEKKRALAAQNLEVAKPEGLVKAAESVAKWLDPLNLEGDLWSCSEKPKWVSGGWMVKMTYPDGDLGRWIPLNHPSDQKSEKRFKWKSVDQDESPLSWILTGPAPKLQSSEWIFFGKKMELVAFHKEKPAGIRFFTDSSGLLNITKETPTSIATLKNKKKNNAKEKDKKSGGSEAASFMQARAAEASFKMGPPLEIESDCWALENRKPKFITGGWMIKLGGPGMIMGRWVQAQSNDSSANAEATWAWQPDQPGTDPFIKEEGGWIFRGRKPQFQDGEWTFFGARPQLSFYFEGESYGNKIELNDQGELVIASDSEAAKKLIPLMERTARGLLPVGTGADSQAKTRDVESGPSLIRAAEPHVKWKDPLELESDIWVAESHSPKWVNGKWLFVLEGPTSREGKWSKVSQVESGDGVWQWTPISTLGASLIKEEGAWIFQGMEPRYNEGEWAFSSKRPNLAFYYEGESYGEKVSCDDFGVLSLTMDSKAALDAQKEVHRGELGIIATDKAESAAPIVAAEPVPDLSALTDVEPAVALEEVEAPEIEVVDSAPQITPESGQVPIEFMAADVQFRVVAPLDLESDCWLMGSMSPRWVNNHWLAHLKGPGPMAGTWQRVPSESPEGAWMWKPTDPVNDRFIREEGAWVFQGQQPKFESGEWIFYSTRPELAFYYEGENYGSKITTDGAGALLFAQDSHHAKEKLGDIEKSSEQVLMSKSLGAAEPIMAAPDDTPTSISIEDVPIVAAPAQVENPQEAVASVVKQEPLGPIALAFLMSELVRKKGLSPEAVAQRFCSYLSAATQKRDVEVWYPRQGSWYPGATHSGFEPKLGDELEEMKKRASVSKRGAILVPIYAEFGDDTGGSELLGALVIGAPLPGQEQKADADFAVAAGEMLRGTLLSLKSNLQSGSLAA